MVRLGWLWFGLAGFGLLPVSCDAVRTTNYHYNENGDLQATGPLGPTVATETRRLSHGNCSLMLADAAADVRLQPLLTHALALQTQEPGQKETRDEELDHSPWPWFLGFSIIGSLVLFVDHKGPLLDQTKHAHSVFQCFVDTGGGEMWFFGKDLVGFAFGVFAFHIPIFQNPLAYLFVLLGMLANQEI